MNGHTAKVFFYELRRNLRRRGYLFTTFGVPLIAIVLLLGYKAISTRNANNPTNTNPTGGTDQAVGFQQRQTRGLRRSIGDVRRRRANWPAVLTHYPDEAAAKAALE